MNPTNKNTSKSTVTTSGNSEAPKKPERELFGGQGNRLGGDRVNPELRPQGAPANAPVNKPVGLFEGRGNSLNGKNVGNVESKANIPSQSKGNLGGSGRGVQRGIDAANVVFAAVDITNKVKDYQDAVEEDRRIQKVMNEAEASMRATEREVLAGNSMSSNDVVILRSRPSRRTNINLSALKDELDNINNSDEDKEDEQVSLSRGYVGTGPRNPEYSAQRRGSTGTMDNAWRNEPEIFPSGRAWDNVTPRMEPHPGGRETQEKIWAKTRKDRKTTDKNLNSGKTFDNINLAFNNALADAGVTEENVIPVATLNEEPNNPPHGDRSSRYLYRIIERDPYDANSYVLIAIHPDGHHDPRMPEEQRPHLHSRFVGGVSDQSETVRNPNGTIPDIVMSYRLDDGSNLYVGSSRNSNRKNAQEHYFWKK